MGAHIFTLPVCPNVPLCGNSNGRDEYALLAECFFCVAAVFFGCRIRGAAVGQGCDFHKKGLRIFREFEIVA